MNAKNFSEYIKNPSQLYQISYQELKSLVLQYPYSQNLRYLLLQKSKLDNHNDFDHNLEMASTYSVDRAFLYKLLKETDLQTAISESFLLSEDVLELKDLNALEEEMAETADQISPDFNEMVFDPDLVFASPQTESPESTDEKKDLEEYVENLLPIEEVPMDDAAPGMDATADELSEPGPDQPKPTESVSLINPETSIEEVVEQFFSEEKGPVEIELIESMASLAEVLEGPRDETASIPSSDDIPLEITNEEAVTANSDKIMPEPEPKTSFNSWLRQFDSPVVEKRLDELADIGGNKKKEDKEPNIGETKDIDTKDRASDKKVRKATEIANESLQESDDIASETLAGILAAQGHFKKAMDMYERLSLQLPEKSSFFAAKIEELKKQL